MSPQKTIEKQFSKSELECAREMQKQEKNQDGQERKVQGAMLMVQNAIVKVIQVAGLATLAVAAAETEP